MTSPLTTAAMRLAPASGTNAAFAGAALGGGGGAARAARMGVARIADISTSAEAPRQRFISVNACKIRFIL
jgi:methyl coenzyme M reductase subunit C